MLPTIAIIGRPNVGKSTLFNRLVGKKLALVDDRPGVTRDRREGSAQLFDLKFTIVDTAGYEEDHIETLPGRMRQQTEAALVGAAGAIFVIDGRVGLTPLDQEIARWLRGTTVPIILVVNKAEGKAADNGIMEAYELGLGEPKPISAEHGEGMAELYEGLMPVIDKWVEDNPQEPEITMDDEYNVRDIEAATLQLAIVGRPNAGKSTLINRLLGENRLITGPEAGITRDSISIDWVWHDENPPEDVDPDRKVKLIDTAGMRKKAKVNDKLERLSVADARRAIDFAEVVVLLLDATKGLEVQDLKIADHVIQEGRALIIAINKWDVAQNTGALFNGIRGALDEGLAQLKGVPMIAVSAFTGKGTDQMIKAAFDARMAWSRRVPTALLNRWFEGAQERNPPPAPGGKRIKLRYVTQARIRPPSFVLFGTRVDQLPESYRRYLLNGIRKELDFGAVPVRLTLRAPKNPYADTKK
ncbi:ribosome biogenesis GTPase Der [Sphingorhabdus lutea]|uniref:GTPase Der n=1 Tax=Sphingorhabdus lutea TaxID=1913578 RepID=A0A1L3J8X9_9SPHN|nr:ribosome biogenesis GTPase Der [Sphingorhabdus lutea]APG61592.1 ribosome biogenesis GTPase Der [Sphingorhabdus lutea]